MTILLMLPMYDVEDLDVEEIEIKDVDPDSVADEILNKKPALYLVD